MNLILVCIEERKRPVEGGFEYDYRFGEPPPNEDGSKKNGPYLKLLFKVTTQEPDSFIPGDLYTFAIAPE